MSQGLKSIQVIITDPRIGKEFPLPAFATAGSAGLDLVACLEAPLVLKPGEYALIDTGLRVFINDPEYVAQLVPRSGTSTKRDKQIAVKNLVGIIDADYQGPLKVAAWNTSLDVTSTIEPGERIAQLVFVKCERPELNFVEAFSDATARGEGGFGSTGKN